MGLIRKRPRKEEQLTKSRVSSEESIAIRVETTGVDNPFVQVFPLHKGGEIFIDIPFTCILTSDCARIETNRKVKVRLTIA